jgi:carbonic anhydrase
MDQEKDWAGGGVSSRGENLAAPAEGALEALRLGNVRFTSGQVRQPHRNADRRQEVTSGQSPFAVVLTCSDSRLPPEIIFDQGIGDLFVVRTAGHVLDDVALGSIEYAVKELNVPLILVLGHQRCTVVSAAVQGDQIASLAPRALDGIREALKPVVDRARAMQGDVLNNAIDENVRLTVDQLKTSEPVLAGEVEAGRLAIIGARYTLTSGIVSFFSG